MRVRWWVMVLSGVMATSAAAFDTRPGEWEVEARGGNASGITPKQRICITPEQAKNRYKAETEPVDAGGVGEMEETGQDKCRTTFSGDNRHVFSYEIACDEKGAKVEIKGVVKKVSEDELVTHSATTVHMGDQKQTQKLIIKQKYRGADCSGDATSFAE